MATEIRFGTGCPVRVSAVAGNKESTIDKPQSTVNKSKLSSWLSLIRLPNGLTVPGDPIAGFLLAVAAGGAGSRLLSDPDAGYISGWGRAVAAVMVSLLLYAHGLIQNDLLDIREDRAVRPHRPLPSGNVGIRAAIMVCILLAVAGIAAAGLLGRHGVLLAVGLTVTVFGYNAGLKHHRGLGPLTMGVCRALSLLLGAVAVGLRTLPPPVLAAAAFLGLYVAAVTSIAAAETQAATPGFRRWGPALVSLAGFALIAGTAFHAGLTTWPYAFLFGWPMGFWAGWVGYGLGGTVQPERIQESVVRWLRGLLFFQFVLIVIGWGSMVAPAAAFLLLWTFHRRLSRSYACT